MARAWMQSFASLRDDERGVESTQVILILVIAVLGLVGAFWLLRHSMEGKAEPLPLCIAGADGKPC